MLNALTDEKSFVRSNAVTALGQAIRADQSLAKPTFPFLLHSLKDNDYSVRVEVITALSQAAQADQSLAASVLPSLLYALKDNSNHSDSVRRSAAIALGQLARADNKLSETIFNALLQSLKNDDDIYGAIADSLVLIVQINPSFARKAAVPIFDALKGNRFSYYETNGAVATAFGQIIRIDRLLANQVFPLLSNALGYEKDYVEMIAAATALEQVVQVDPTLASKMVIPLLSALGAGKGLEEGAVQSAYEASKLKRASALTLGRVAQANPALANVILPSLLTAIEDDKNKDIRDDLTIALNQVAQANPGGSLTLLLTALKDDNLYVCFAAANALVKVALTDKPLGNQILKSLLDALKHNYLSRGATAAALGELTQAEHSLVSQTLPLLLDLLKQVNDSNDLNGNERKSIAVALVQVAQADPKARTQMFRLLVGYDKYVRDGVKTPLARLLFTLAVEEQKAGRDPLRFLLDHLEGRQSFLAEIIPGGNANTYAVYRTVVVKAIAQFLDAQEAEFKPHQERLRQQLAEMRDTDRRLHLRIAAWNVFVEAAELRDKRQHGEE